MFDNIGKKIKILVTVMVIISSIVSILFGLGLVLEEKSTTSVRLVGLSIVILGPLFSWISGFMMYAFGEITEKICSIEESINKKESQPSEIESLWAEPEAYEKPTFYNPMNQRKEEKGSKTEEADVEEYPEKEIQESEKIEETQHENNFESPQGTIRKSVKYMIDNFRF